MRLVVYFKPDTCAQWGHDAEVVKEEIPRTRTKFMYALQWGHDAEVVE